MACTLRVSPHENIEKTVKRWAQVLDLLKRERELTHKIKNLKPFETEKKAKLKSAVKESRNGETEAIKTARKRIYTPLDNFLVYLNEEWEMSFETYQVLELIFRATIASHERELFDYGRYNYVEKLKNLNGTPQEKYQTILKCIKHFSKDSFFGVEDIHPSKMDYVNDVNVELNEYISQISRLQEQIKSIEEDKNSPLRKVAEELRNTARNMESWAYGKVLGKEQNRGFLSFKNGQIIMDHKNFLYFKIYILAFMGTFGEFSNRVHPDRNSLLCQLAEKKLKFESGKHFDFKITPRFLSGRERFANNDRQHVENLPYDKGFLDSELLSYIIERNEELIESGELPFYLVQNLKESKTA